MAMTLVPSYNTKRVFGTWVRQAGTEMRPGNYRVTVPVRITNATDDVIIPEGVYATGILNTTVGLPSLDIQAPCTDDPDNWPQGWQLLVEITFPDAPKELYVLNVPVAGTEGINLRTVILAQVVPDQQSYLIRGVAGGVAGLDGDGDVIDAAGTKVLPGGDGSGTALTSYVTQVASLSDYPVGFTPSVGSVIYDHLNAALQAAVTKADASLSQTEVDARANAMITAWVGAAPDALNTLIELAQRIESESGEVDALVTALADRVLITTFDAHTANTAAHGATSSPTASTILRRDTAGKSQVATPTDSDTSTAIATTGYVKTKVSTLVGSSTLRTIQVVSAATHDPATEVADTLYIGV